MKALIIFATIIFLSYATTKITHRYCVDAEYNAMNPYVIEMSECILLLNPEIAASTGCTYIS